VDYREMRVADALPSEALISNGHAQPSGNGHVELSSDGHVDLHTNGNGRVAPRVSVVIPALNEARNIPLVFANLPPDLFEIILVDGSSTDGTIEVAKSLRPDVRVVSEPRPGKGIALISGFEASRGDIIVALDADGSTDAAEIARFVAALEEGADFVKGSRFLAGGGSADLTPVRRLGNWLLRSSANALHGTRYTDLCYGYNAFWRRCLPQLDLDCDGFEVETVMNIRAARANLRVTEVPSFESKRVHGESHLNVVRDGMRILRTILAERRRAREPGEHARAVEVPTGSDAYSSALPQRLH
jgi:glycosyltransferase involved in cell wall biosynthesis